MSSISNIDSRTILSHDLGFAKPLEFKEIPADEFFRRFQNAKQIHTDEVEFSQESSISSVEMDDCITIFGIERDADGKIAEISAYHPASLTDEEEMLEEYFDSFEKGASISFYIIGGNDASTTPGDLLSTILTTIENCFGNTECIKEQLTGINKGSSNQFSTANIQMDGTLTYCMHKTLS